ncbi:MAG TPA: protein-L-isoaspartate(D-aspartate) O-methyltransferase [Luteibaculaceae bacterium]|nr:protein-L-isoaspartate(D-aspartate) O-methyltransferase [Luteibaculaceae bacterium]
MRDDYRHKGLRRQMIHDLAELGITDAKVLDAIDRVPRHLFMDSAFVELAYQNKAFPIGAGQTISKPHTVAFQSSLLQIEPGEKVLEIGTGSGYQTSVLVELGARVWSIERQKYLFDKTRLILAKLNYRPYLSYGDGFKGLPGYAPFNKIIVTCGAPFIPPALLTQLTVGGRMVIPVEQDGVLRMKVIDRVTEVDFEEQLYGEFKFVPMLEKRQGKSV